MVQLNGGAEPGDGMARTTSEPIGVDAGEILPLHATVHANQAAKQPEHEVEQLEPQTEIGGAGVHGWQPPGGTAPLLLYSC